MVYTRKHVRGDLVYYERLESYRDEDGVVQKRKVQWLGDSATPPPEPIPLKGVDFAELSIKLMEESMTQDDVFRLLGEIGKKPAEVAELEAIGIRFDLAQKKLLLYLFPKGYDWKVAPRRAPRAKAASGGKGRTTGAASSRSKAKPK